uniref:Uncharacterized protein n=1 Tax=Avena sativa TaxID=4498 RepID=A0ACD5WLI6_AVESA
MSQAIVQRACAKLRSAIGDEPVLRLNFTGDLQEMLDALEIIQPVLEKAEMQLLGRNFSTGWLQQVRHAAYRIMDMVDELQDTRQPAAATMTRMPPRLAIKMNATRNEIIRLKEYWHSYISVKEVAFTQLRQQVMDERATIPCLEEASVVGRASDKQNIVAVLQSAASNVIQGSPRCIILPIFGIAGSGKSTLAQMVFNDDGHSLQQYNCRVWVYVSPELNFYEIGESILYQVMSGEGEKEKINDHCLLESVL